MSTVETSSGLTRLRSFRLPTLAVALVTAAIVIFSMSHSFATWMISRTGSGVLNSGTLSFQLKDSNGQNASPSDPLSIDSPRYTFAALTLNSTSLLPGDTRVALMNITNTGATPLSLTFTGVTTNASTTAQKDFVGSLSLGAIATTTASCLRTQFTSDLIKPLSGVTTATPLTVIPTTNTLKPAESRYLCVALNVSATSPNTAQGQSSTLTIQVRADQQR
ncbi:hypothetical protein GCM10022198_23270 [Klugiella xanthotipulae]|uniref:Ribosomally synthesized peptide with SipW-like signal peptide n=1 Tax=Klugiella xanthotipulae TaxID=244735 RepID=A0A543I5R1_9MICO|nr:hypothetical protein [Klugiella xanthotipulae]TQM65946.1 hypothetical protein FB466_0766 [Klugiella xanthotipulae]